MSIEFDVYAAAAPKGTKLATLTDLEVKEFRVSLADTGEGRLVINRASPQATAANFAQDNVIKVRVTEVSANPIFAFLLQEGNFVAVSTGEEADETLEFGGPGLLQYLDRAIMPDYSSIGADPGQTGNEGYWPLYLQSLGGGNTAAGSMFLRCINEALGRTPNPYPDLTVDFSHTNDSSGAAWTTHDGTFRVPIGDSVLTVLRKFQTLGLEVQVTPNLLVRAFENYGTDRSATVTLAKGVNILTGVERAIHATPEKSNIMVGGENYTYVYVSTAAPIVREGFFGYGTTDSVTALAKAGQVELARRSDDTDKIDVGLLPLIADGGYIPGPAGTSGDFWVGDKVRLHTGTAPLDYNMATRRVSGIRFSEREAGDFDVVVELNGTGTEGSSSTGASLTPETGPTLPPVLPGDQVNCGCPPEPPTTPTSSGGGSLRLYHSSYLSGTTTFGASAAANAEAEVAPDLDQANIAAGWAGYTGGVTYEMLYETPQNSEADANSNWTASNQAAGLYAIWGYVRPLTNASLLSIVQGGGSVRQQVRARSRYGIGISEATQDNRAAWAIRVYRPGTGFVATLLAPVAAGSMPSPGLFTKFPAQAGKVNRLFSSTFAAYSGAVSTDYLVFDMGTHHVGPTSGGTGSTLGWTDTGTSDLPEDEASTLTYNSWVELSGGGTPGSTSGDTPSPTVLPGTESFGDPGCYAPCGHTHAQGTLSADGTHYLDASTIQYSGTLSGLTATDTQEAIDDLAAVNSASDPTASDSEYSVGKHWVNTTTDSVFFLVDNTSGAAVWSSGGGGGGGHTIKENGTLLTARSGLNFGAGILATDDVGNDETNVDLTANQKTFGLDYVIDGGGNVITTGGWGDVRIPAGCTITGAEIRSRVTGSIVVDVQRATNYGTFSSICGGTKPALSAANQSVTTISAWTTSLSQGDFLSFVVDSASTVQRVTVSLQMEKT